MLTAEQKRKEKQELRELQKKEKAALKEAEDAQRHALAGISAQPSMLYESGWRRCNCPKGKCQCVVAAPMTQEMWEQLMAQAQHYHYMQSIGGKAAQKGGGGKRGKRAAQADQPPPPPVPPCVMWPPPPGAHLDPHHPEGGQAWARGHGKQAHNDHDATAANNGEEGQQGNAAEAQTGEGHAQPSASQNPRKRARDSQPPAGQPMPYMHPYSAAAWASYHPPDECMRPAAMHRPPTLKEICQERYGPEVILSPGNQTLPSSNVGIGGGCVDGASGSSSLQKQPQPDVPPSDDLPAHVSVDML